jgi:hypothetical protein
MSYVQASTGLNPILAKIAQQRAEAKNQGREANAAQAVLLEARLRLIDDLGLSGFVPTYCA